MQIGAYSLLSFNEMISRYNSVGFIFTTPQDVIYSLTTIQAVKSSVQFSLESYLVCLRFVKFKLDQTDPHLYFIIVESRNKLAQKWMAGWLASNKVKVEVEAEFNSFILVQLRLEINFHGGGWVADWLGGWIIEE